MSNKAEWQLHDPYVYGMLAKQVGTTIGVQTTRGALRGILKAVQPDHLVVEMGGTPFYVRSQQIIWVHPAKVHQAKAHQVKQKN
ncbi:Uncharacterized protein yuzF [Niallia circulans]|jgi:hypothetical protein|uniref:YuzF family protein n=1 Tax=Shouchella clausii TaxID=79880 RepID=UPI000BA62D29|nr:YuzF family protein [Shouchella clausii]MCM3548520.1 YuzF family protein [Shouchella clausii]PAD92460.1 hypothetical protein CHH52_09575 [Shouchella clausii]PAF13817.1 hypothetical protein CHH59_12305 [Shouchella clausii]SPT78389.1 Uncharacterized protein yuzF [Niallia circulans]